MDSSPLLSAATEDHTYSVTGIAANLDITGDGFEKFLTCGAGKRGSKARQQPSTLGSYSLHSCEQIVGFQISTSARLTQLRSGEIAIRFLPTVHSV